jgi:hypothetical protein
MGGSTTGACQLDSGACDAARRVSEATKRQDSRFAWLQATRRARHRNVPSDINPPSPPSFREEPVRKYGLFSFIFSTRGGMRIPDWGFDNWRMPVGQRSLRRCPQSERSSSIPPSPPSFREEPVRKCLLFSFIFSRRGGMRIPDGGFDNWRMPVGQRSLRRCPQGERSESI